MAGMKKSEALEQVLARARKDPTFFHQLVFDQDAAMEAVPRDRELRSAIYGLDGEHILSALLGSSERLKFADGCTSTCGESCTNTCGAQSCEGTCGGSCTNTCNSSCGATAKRLLSFRETAELSAALGARSARRAR